jgi:hypothetical protein
VERDTFIGCYLLADGIGESGYKPMDESMGPFHFSCPLAYLDMVPETNREWREHVRAYHAQNQQEQTPQEKDHKELQVLSPVERVERTEQELTADQEIRSTEAKEEVQQTTPQLKTYTVQVEETWKFTEQVQIEAACREDAEYEAQEEFRISWENGIRVDENAVALTENGQPLPVRCEGQEAKQPHPEQPKPRPEAPKRATEELPHVCGEKRVPSNIDTLVQNADKCLSFYQDEDKAFNVIDCLADLMHWCDAYDIDFKGRLARAEMHHNAEVYWDLRERVSPEESSPVLEKASYTPELDSDEQISAEELISSIIYDSERWEGDDEEASAMGREILRGVLRRFRPDLFQKDAWDVPAEPLAKPMQEISPASSMNDKPPDRPEAAAPQYPSAPNREAKSEEGSGPLYDLRSGCLQFSIFEREGPDGATSFTFSPSRSYKDKDGNWQQVNSFYLEDLPHLKEVVAKTEQLLTEELGQSLTSEVKVTHKDDDAKQGQKQSL